MKNTRPGGKSFKRQTIRVLDKHFPLGVLPVLCMTAVNASASSDAGNESSLFTVLIFISGLVAVAVLLIAALTRWGHKQDRISNMMIFCIKYLVETRNEVQKCEAAQALGQVKDPGALLILVDVINDESAESNLRKTARDALVNLSGIYGKYQQVIDDLLSAEERKDHEKSIDILISNFENQNRKYVQSAYVVGREFMRLKDYAEAREWLQKAKSRNEKSVVYVNQIAERIRLCNEKLFSQGDVLFKVGDYYDALERYALASHDLDHEEKQRFASHLRLACVYCRLKHYEDAYQETLHALHDHHETDYSLRLNSLLKGQRGEIGGTPEAQERRKETREKIDNYITTIMSELATRNSES